MIAAPGLHIAQLIEGLVDPFVPASSQPPRDVWPYLWQTMKPMRKVIALSIFFAVIAGSIEVWLIGYAGRLIDTLVAVQREDLWQTHGATLIGVALMMLVLRPVFHFAREGLNDLAFRPNTATLARWRAHRHVSQQSVGWFQDDLSGRTASRVVEIGASVSNGTYRVINTLVYVSIYLVGIIILMSSSDIRLALPLLLWMALYALLMVMVVPKMRSASEAYQGARSALTGTIVDTYSNIATVALFADKALRDADEKAQFEAMRQRYFELQRVEVVLNVAITVLEGLMLVGLVGYGIFLWQQGDASLGLVAAALALGFKITSMAEWFLDAVAGIFANLGALREALKTVGEPLVIVDAPDAKPLQIAGGALHIEGVSHHYGKMVGGLDDITLEIAAGEKVGLVGPSGAGKSTLMNLILRFFELEAGRIKIDGQDVCAVTQESLRRSIAMVSQESSLLHRSVRDNIAFGRDIADADLVAAAKKAEAHSFVKGLEDQKGRKGYDAHVGERGVKLSGGQRQRIAIARVILKDAPILILDEATSALDSEVEAAIQETLYGVMEGKTVIAIAHRLSTIAEMDRIVVLDRGRVVEVGKHDELLANGGLYATLWARQSGGFIGHAAE